MKRLLAGMALAVLLLGACDSGSTSEADREKCPDGASCATPSTSSTATESVPPSSATTPDFAPCGTVSASFTEVLGIPTGAYTKATTLLGNGHQAWYVAGVGGSLWVTDREPSSADAGGLILPLNAAAQSASDYGANVQLRAPIYGATTEHDAQAQKALDCYK